MALPPRQDGRAHDRRPPRHRRLGRLRPRAGNHGDASARAAATRTSALALSAIRVSAGTAAADEGALMGFAGSMRANCCTSQLGFAGAWVTPSGISIQGSFSAHQICRLGATQLGSSNVPALVNAIAPYAGPWL